MVSGIRRMVLFYAVASMFDASAQAAPRKRRSAPVLIAAVEPPAPDPAFLPAPAPPPLRVETIRKRRWGLFSGGLVLFAAGQALDIGVSYGLNHGGAELSLIPLVGPLAQMGDRWGTIPAMKSGNPQIDVPANQRIDQANQAIQAG